MEGARGINTLTSLLSSVLPGPCWPDPTRNHRAKVKIEKGGQLIWRGKWKKSITLINNTFSHLSQLFVLFLNHLTLNTVF